MGLRTAVKVMPLHDPLKPFAYRHTAHIHALALGKNICFDGGADLSFLGRREFPQVTEGRQLRFREMRFQRLVALSVRYLLEGDLDRRVAIPLGGFHLRHAAGTGFNHGDRHHAAA